MNWLFTPPPEARRVGHRGVQLALALALLYFPVCGLAGWPLGNGGRYLTVLAGPLALIFVAFHLQAERHALARQAWQFAAPFAPFLIAAGVILWVHPAVVVGDPFSRVLWAIPIALAAARLGITRRAVFSAAALGALAYAAVAFRDVYWLGAGRAGAAVNEIIFAETAMLCAGLALIGAAHEHREATALRAGWLIAGAAGIAAVALSGSRGPLLAAVWLIALAGATLWRRRAFAVIGLGVVAVVAALALAWFATPLAERVAAGRLEFDQYWAASQAPITSVGIRLELWRIALSSMNEHWLIGIGYSALSAAATALPALRFLSPEQLEPLHHFHADWAHALVAGGVILAGGLALTITALFRSARHDLARLWLIGAMLVFGLTDLAFFRKPTLTLFVAAWALLGTAPQSSDPPR